MPAPVVGRVSRHRLPTAPRGLRLVRRLAPVLALVLLVSAPAGASAHYSLRWPVAGGSISQYYHSGHRGIDIRAPYGTRVYAAHSGRIQFSGWKSNGGGHQIWLRHGDGRSTTYSHMSSLWVRTGAYVYAGQTIGRVGCSGWCSGAHLHFELWVGAIWNGGYRINPLRYM